MQMIDYKFSLELTKNGVQKSIHAKASEENARRMIITLTVNGNVYDITDHKVRVFFHDGTYVDTASVEDGRIVFILPEALTSFAGEKTCEFKVYRDKEFVNVIYSPMVAIIVEGRVSGKEETELIGKKFEYQETIPNLPSADSIADDDEIAVYDNSVGNTVRILWSKIKGLFVSKKEIEDTNKYVDEVNDQVETNTKGIEELDKKLDPLEESVESLVKSAHSHDNKTNVLDELGVNEDNNLTFQGKEIKSSLGKSGIKSRTYDSKFIFVGADATGNGIVDFVVYESEEGFFDNKVIVDVTWEDDMHGYVDTGVLIDNNLLDGSCVESVLNRPAYLVMWGGYCVFRLYSPNSEGYAELVSNGSDRVNNVSIKYIEV
jgi:hypothetical protein